MQNGALILDIGLDGVLPVDTHVASTCVRTRASPAPSGPDICPLPQNPHPRPPQD